MTAIQFLGGAGASDAVATVSDTSTIDMSLSGGGDLSAVIPTTASPTLAGLTVSNSGAAASMSITNSAPSGLGDSILYFRGASSALKWSLGYRDSTNALIIAPNVVDSHPVVFVNWDGTGGGSRVAFSCAPTSWPNGTNGDRGDSITSDTANSTNSTFWNVFQSNPPAYTGKGSQSLFYGNYTISDASDGGSPVYREASAFQSNVTASSKGALTKSMEIFITTVSGKPARVNNLTTTVIENIPYASYNDTSAFGSTSPYLKRGASVLDSCSFGTYKVGSGIVLWGSTGFQRHFIIENPSGVEVTTIDQLGQLGFGIRSDQTNNTGGFPCRLNLGYTNTGVASTVLADGAQLGGDIYIYRSTTKTLTFAGTTSTGMTLEFLDGTSAAAFALGTTNGLKIGTSTSQKLGFFNVTPKTQPSALTARVNALTDSTSGTAGNTLVALPNPADTPLSADNLRDDLVANVLPVLRDWAASLAAKVSNLKTRQDEMESRLNSNTSTGLGLFAGTA